MDAAQWPQVGFTRSMEEIITSNNPTQPPPPQHQHQHQHQQQDLDGNNQRKVRPQKDQIVNCPRCNSTNTKFCYYNNYSLTQPRYFCKTCRRYWTQGGSLRNVPVGGGSRKNKRSNPQTSSSSSSPSKLIPDLNPPASFLIPPHNHLHHQNPSYKIHNHGQDLNLAFPTSTMLQSMEFPKIESSGDLVDRSTRSPNNTTTAPASTSTPISSMELLRAPVICSSGLGSAYVQVPMSVNSNALYNSSSGFLNLHEMKPNLMGPSFNIGSLQEGNHQANSDGVARLLFPFGDLNKFSSQNNAPTNTARSDHQVDSHQSIKGSSQDHHHHHHHQQQQQQGESGFWNGMLGGGTW